MDNIRLIEKLSVKLAPRVASTRGQESIAQESIAQESIAQESIAQESIAQD